MHSELLVQLATQRLELRLAVFDAAAGQIPDVGVGSLGRAAADEEDAPAAYQRAEHDVGFSVHDAIAPPGADSPGPP